MSNIRIYFIIALIFITIKGLSQKPLTFNGYIEAYYAYDFNRPVSHNIFQNIYSYNRYNEVTLNLGFIKAAYQVKNVRANLALASGTYINANLAAEPGVLKNIYEANAGIKITPKKELWIDAGIFSSHIGFESAIGKDCWTLTRSMLADNSPYYESGVKISYTGDNGKWFICGLVLNGWQRIQRADGNNTLAFGHQLTFKPNKNVILNSSSFVGNDKPDSIKQMRYFHNFYGIFQLNKKLALTTGFDFGTEQKSKESGKYNTWYSPVIIVKFSPDEKSNFAVRAEYYRDTNGVIITTGSPNGFQTWSCSFNYDYLIQKNVMWRIESRYFSSKDKIFAENTDELTNSLFLTTVSLAISF